MQDSNVGYFNTRQLDKEVTKHTSAHQNALTASRRKPLLFFFLPVAIESFNEQFHLYIDNSYAAIVAEKSIDLNSLVETTETEPLEKLVWVT